jgi:hypothetical protein
VRLGSTVSLASGDLRSGPVRGRETLAQRPIILLCVVGPSEASPTEILLRDLKSRKPVGLRSACPTLLAHSLARRACIGVASGP